MASKCLSCAKMMARILVIISFILWSSTLVVSCASTPGTCQDIVKVVAAACGVSVDSAAPLQKGITTP